jgi:biopolymer transport protein ExbD
MGVSFTAGDDVMSDINITPFVDIILVVLIIFMVTATRIVEQSLLVDLPEAASGEQPESLSLGLTLMEDGRLLLDGVDIDTEQLRAALRQAKATEQEVVCLIAADELVAHGRVVWLMDLIKSEGISHFAINIDPSRAIPPDPASVGKGLGVAPTGTIDP